MKIKQRVKKVLNNLLDDKEASATAERKRKSDDALRAKGGSIARIRLSPKATIVLESLAAEYGSKTQAIEQILSDYEQRSLL